MDDIFTKKQLEFILKSTAKWNLAHGAVRSGKTECTLFRFMHAVHECPDSQIYMIGHTADTIYQNAVRLIFECPRFAIFKPFCHWLSSSTTRVLKFKDKTIKVLGAKDEGAIGQIQGKTMSLVYCDEMTLYPLSIIDMIDTRLSMPYSQGFASMNPSYPSHPLKKWIEWAEEGDRNYYSLHFSIDDNTFLPEDFKERLRKSLQGLFYKRFYEGQWCLADGAIFDFFDKSIYVVNKPPRAAEYFIAGVDYGSSNPLACLIIGVNTGIKTQSGKCLWVESEYFHDPKISSQKTHLEYAEELYEFLHAYGVQSIYIDPSANAFEYELKRFGLPVIHADNDVLNGITYMTGQMKAGNLFVRNTCINTIREIEAYSWDSKKSERGEDEPIKKNDHCMDALRYALYSHKVSTYDPYKEKDYNKDYIKNRFESRRYYG